MNLSDFITEHDITATVEPAASNPNMTDWDRDASHWLVTLQVADRSMAVPFSQGSAHTEPPTAADVLESLASDSAGYINAGSFEDWADEYGYDTDSRKAFGTYEAIGVQAAELRTLLTDEAFEALLEVSDDDDEDEDDDDDETYKVVRHCFDQDSPDNGRVIATGLTLDEAQEHCQREDTHGEGWFDGYTAE
jgi:hypothetical protein